MNQNRYGVFVSLCLLLLLTAGFFVAARYAVKAVNGSVERAIATATVVVLPPTNTPVPASPTPHGYKPKPHHIVSGPAPTATPIANNQVVISTSSQLAGATTSFPEGTSRYWCVANLPAIPLGAGIVWKWEQVNGNTTQAIWTSQPFTYSSSVRYGYIDGPFQTGHYRCTVIANAQIIGAADFTVK
jgi:hypothetical protein